MIGPVTHRSTGAPGTATRQTHLHPATAGDLAGPWSYVHFDDGLTCWCPDADLHAGVCACVVRTFDLPAATAPGWHHQIGCPVRPPGRWEDRDLTQTAGQPSPNKVQ